ncbi:MarR family winged helix-turn-helix transcriptional regulator [Nonomuraea wenchangensis]|uniref:DNA-binding transcriptional regulator, MarR family n=1 Tax=Nonomuraea wenchangensis TaxID=568860 RepID=A0A1I0H050_9ACTN|nr:MarR family transcriptional regulator [Nonomuraea wenchangensis]SET77079.1 DNA-binding transcriptional regulator, MarR family [Nonomuraea wenchangensis]
MSVAWSRVAEFASAVDASLDKWLTHTYRLGLTEFRALTFLSQAPGKELRVNDLAQRVGLNPSSTTRLVSRLEAKGLTHRDVCPDDGRGVYAVIDERAEKLLAEVRGPYEDRVQELLSKPAIHFPHLDARLIAGALAEVGALAGP